MRFPQTGRVGVVREVDDIKSTKPMSAPRSIQFLKDDGNEIHAPIRSAGAAGNGHEGSDNSAMRYVLAKARHYGWLPVGCCPVDLVQRRERHPLQLFAVDLRTAATRGEACKPQEVGLGNPPCKHYQAEHAARKARRLKDHERQVELGKTATDKQTEALVNFVEKMDVRTTVGPSAPPDDHGPPTEPAGRKVGK